MASVNVPKSSGVISCLHINFAIFLTHLTIELYQSGIIHSLRLTEQQRIGI